VKEKTKLFIYLLIGVLIRLIIAPFVIDPIDFSKYAYPCSEEIITGGILYKNSIWNHVPLYVFICGFMNLIGKGIIYIFPLLDSPVFFNFLFKIPVILADLGIGLIIYKITRDDFKVSEKKGLLLTAIYFFNPLVLMQMLQNRFDSIPTFLILLGAMLVFRTIRSEERDEKNYYYVIAGCLVGLAFLIKENAILVLPILLLAVFQRKDFKNAAFFGGSSVLTMMAGILPFLLIFPESMIDNILSHPASEKSFDGMSLWAVLGAWLPILGVTSISESLLGWGSLVTTTLLCLVICFIAFLKRENLATGKQKFFILLSAITLAFIGLFRTNHPQYYIWFLPFFILGTLLYYRDETIVKSYRTIITIELISFIVLSIGNLGFQICFIPGIFNVSVTVESWLGAISAVIYCIGCLVCCYFEILRFLEIDEIIKITQFMVVGASGTLITWFSLFALVESGGLVYWLGYVISYSIGIINNFIWNLLWTFRKESQEPKREFIKYLIVNLFSLGGYWGLSSLLTYTFQIHYWVSNVLGTALSFAINYILNRLWTFKYEDKDKVIEIEPVEIIEPCSIIIPMFNEEGNVQPTIQKVYSYLKEAFPAFEIIIAEDGAEDKTPEISEQLANEYEEVAHIHKAERQGRGRSLTRAIRKAKYDIVLYMDADLATDLSALPIAIGMIINGADIAYGDRFHSESKTERPLIREITSRGYNLFIRLLFRDKVRDHQCGFKAFNRKSIDEILNKIIDNGWFWDSEIIIRGIKEGLIVKSFPVLWTEHRELQDSKVNILKDIRNMAGAAIRLKRKLRKEDKN
jgi:hypothetical protein